MSQEGDAADDVFVRGERQTNEADYDTTMATVSAGPHNGGQPNLVPEAVIEALVEVAWSFPGLRVSYARMFGPRAVRHLASAGADGLPDFTGAGLDLSGADELLEAFRTADKPIAIEDVRADARTRPIVDALLGQGTRSCLIWPVRRYRDPHPMGWIALDSDKPRTWGSKEEAALERLDPLVLMALDHAALSESLAIAKAEVREHERRAGGLRGFASGILHHTNILVAGLMQVVATHVDDGAGEKAAALGRQLEGVLTELEALKHGTRTRSPEPLDLNSLISELLPALRVLMGEDARMLSRFSLEPLIVEAHRAGFERMVFHLLSHAYSVREKGGESIVIETARSEGGAALILYGDGLGVDDGLLQVGGRGDMVTSDSLRIGLWLAHCEALLHNVQIQVSTEHGNQARIRLLMPLVGSD